MKKILYTLALVVIGFTASYAQKPERGQGKLKGTPEQRAEKAANAMQLKLSLSADQKSKVTQLELDRIHKSDEWRNADDGTMKAKGEERKAFMKANKEKMDAILTPEQRKIVEASRSEMRDKMKDRKGAKRRKGDTPPPPPARNN